MKNKRMYYGHYSISQSLLDVDFEKEVFPTPQELINQLERERKILEQDSSRFLMTHIASLDLTVQEIQNLERREYVNYLKSIEREFSKTAENKKTEK